VAGSKFRTEEDPQMLAATAEKLVASATWCPEFVHPWSGYFSGAMVDRV
jgi:hypothetical protein